MQPRMKKAAKVFALLVAFVVLQVYVQADLLATRSNGGATATAAQPSAGRLTTRGNNPVTVNGNTAHSGDSVFSGQQIQTPDGTGASVQLPGLGKVDLAPNTGATITFGAGKITVTLLSGCVVLSTNKGTAGSVESGGAEIAHTDPSKNSSVDVCTSKTPGAAPIVGAGAAAAAGAGAAATTAAATTAALATGGLFGIGVPATVALVTAASAFTVGAAFATTRGCSGEAPRGPNPSPGTPRGGCQ